MIDFVYVADFQIDKPLKVQQWLEEILKRNKSTVGEITYIFCDDVYLHKLNLNYLNHDTLTDVISFDYSVGNIISGDIFISIDRVKENAIKFGKSFTNELHRVIIHGVLHFLGYKDSTDSEKLLMRQKEDDFLKLLST